MSQPWHTEYLDAVALVAWLTQTADSLGLPVDPHGRGTDAVSQLIAAARRGETAVEVMRAE